MKYRASDNGRGRVAGFIYPFYKNVVAQAPGSTNVQLQCHRLADLLG